MLCRIHRTLSSLPLDFTEETGIDIPYTAILHFGKNSPVKEYKSITNEVKYLALYIVLCAYAERMGLQ